MNRHTYEVFARINRGDDLVHVGTIEAQNDELAIAYAAFVYNEEDWTDMVVVRREHLLTVHQPKPLFEKERVTA